MRISDSDLNTFVYELQEMSPGAAVEQLTLIYKTNVIRLKYSLFGSFLLNLNYPDPDRL